MKKQHILTFLAGVFLLGSPLGQLSAQDPAPETTAPAAPKAEEKKEAKPVDPDKEKWNAVKKQATEDPKVKAALDSATEAKRQADIKMFEKMRELDPSLSPKIDMSLAKLKPKEPKAPKPDAKAAAKPEAAKSADKAAGDKPAKDKTAKDKAPVTPATTPAKDKPAPATKPAAKPATS